MEVASLSDIILFLSSLPFALPHSFSFHLHHPYPSALIRIKPYGSNEDVGRILSLFLTLHPFTPVPIHPISPVSITAPSVMKHGYGAHHIVASAHDVTLDEFTSKLRSFSADRLQPKRPRVGREDVNNSLTRVRATHLMLPANCESFDPAMRFVYWALAER
jgi:hypothetical protein